MMWAGFLEHWPTAASGMADVLGWVSPVAWVLWGIVTALCLLLALGLHLLATRIDTPEKTNPQMHAGVP